MSDSPPRPRDAASLIIARRERRGFVYLMGRRHHRARFLPGFFVFPGGAVEPADREAKPASRLDLTHLAAMGVGDSAAAATVLATAAVRETYEETGIMIAALGHVGDVFGATFDEMRRRGVAPALDCLTYLGRAITPVRQPMRFHARFFLTCLEGGHDDLKGDGELECLLWVSLADIASLPTTDVTSFMAEFAGAVIAPARPLPDGRPVFSTRGRHRLIRYL